MLNVREVAEELKVSTATVYRLIASGVLEGIRSGQPRKKGSKSRGGAIRVPEQAVQAHLTRASLSSATAEGGD
ncbi:helix-turn-helix domain-containing protein [Streptomyces sp. NBC_00989]|uniref:helix-turn-helix domain-containing protein n=1 Tax=Streptomyces sp. NBC_00989 TaxID=2903705 RepID=UPI0038643D66|nr:helix-turn-helix domain-containing protein [Streptomyces sp. NBC_00989]